MMKFSVPSAALAVIAALSLPAAATAQSARCVNSDQVAGLAAAMLPNVVTKMSTKCASVLPEGAALRVSGAAAAEQYRDAALAARPKAMEAIAVIAGDDLPPGMSADVVFPFIEAMLDSELDKGDLSDTCPVVNNLWSALKGLPFENWGLVMAAVVSADQKDKADKADAKPSKRRSMGSDLPICPYIAMES
jgi:hypothetical protein